MGQYVVAVDVGTGSARSGLYDRAGILIARAEHPIALLRTDTIFAQHSSSDIWRAVCVSVNEILRNSEIPSEEIDAIGFDATCSLVVLDSAGRSLPVRPGIPENWDTISWMDHRARHQANQLTKGNSDALRYLGGVMSPEMQVPKLAWLKSCHPDTWGKAGLIFDLADFLVWKATGSRVRSVCTLTAKWNYLAHQENSWDDDLLAKAGLGDLVDRAGIPTGSGQTGQSAGALTADAAAQLGLSAGTVVAFGLVDAFSGAVSVLGGDPEENGRAALIGGTSSCIMRLSSEPEFLPSFWGPYLGAAIPGKWIIEGGQSATGAFLDYVIDIHGNRGAAAKPTHDDILARIEELRQSEGLDFARGIHVLPDFHGNRSPFGDADARGVIHGLSMDGSLDGICRLYWRSMVAMALSIRQIVEVMEGNGRRLDQLVLGGGHARNALFVQLYADATGKEIVLSAGDEAMMLGTAMVAATAAGWHEDLVSSCRFMRRQEKVFRPDPAAQGLLERDYVIFRQMQAHRQLIRSMDIG